MVEIHYHDLNQNMKDKVSGWLYSESDLLTSESDGLLPSARKLITNNAPLNFISFDGNGIDLTNPNKSFYSEGDYIGFISGNVSNEFCETDSNDSIHLSCNEGFFNFDKGITISFYDNCCSEIMVKYIFSDTTSEFETYVVNDELFHFQPSWYHSENVMSMEIYFTKTKLPYQFIKVSYIKFGEIFVWNKIKDINLIEEINVLSEDLPINALNFSIFLKEPFRFQENSPINIYSNNKYYGTFYLDKTERISKCAYSIKALNCLSILENNVFDNWQREIDLCDFANEIKTKTGVEIIEPSETPYTTFGFVPVNSCRFCLCATAFAFGLMVCSSRDDKITLLKTPSQITSVIKTSDKRIIGEATYQKEKPISAVKLQEINGYEPESNVALNYDKSGKYYFDNAPLAVADPEDMTNISFFNTSLNFLEYESPNSLSLNGIKISFYAKEYTISNPNVHTSNEKDLRNFTLSGRIYDITDVGVQTWEPVLRDDDAIKYMQSGGTVKAKIVLEDERVGDLIQIETAYDGIKTGIITSMSIGFGYRDIAEIEVLEWPIG